MATTLPDAFPHPEATHRVVLGTTQVAYHLHRSARTTLGLRVDDHGLLVSAPWRASQRDIEHALQAKARWILAKLLQHHERQRQQADLHLDWGEGTRLPCLGGHLVLHLDPARRHVGGPTLPAPFEDAHAATSPIEHPLYLPLASHSPPQAVRQTTARWLQAQALTVFQQRCAHYAPRLGVQPTRLALTSARTRWGSATSQGVIRLHWHLLHFPLAVLDYVVVHELAHLREMNHGAAFWALVHALIPNAAACQAALRQKRPIWWR